MEKFDINTSIEQIYNDDDLRPYYNDLFYKIFDKPSSFKVKDLNPQVWPIQDEIDGLNYMKDWISKGYVNRYPLYKKEYQDKDNIGLVEFKKGPNKKVIIVVPGGGYSNVCMLGEGLPFVKPFFDEGFTIYTLTYSVQKDAFLGGSNEDLIKAINFLVKNQENLKINMENYIVIGFSAGGHLVSQLGTTNHGYLKHDLPRPGLLVLGYPVIDFTNEKYTGSRTMIIGKNPSEELKKEYSTNLNFDDSFPATYLWQCDHDNVVPIENSMSLADKLMDFQIPHIYRTYPSDAHGWSIATGKAAEGWIYEMLDFYKKLYK